MSTGPDFSVVAALIGDTARASMLSILLGGQSLPASELAYAAYITPQTASHHLAKLVNGGLLEVTRSGRHRYYKLKNTEVAHALETLLAISSPIQVRSRHSSPEHQALCFARTCYDHLAGKLGVAVTQAFVQTGLIVQDDQAFRLTAAGSAWLAAHRIAEAPLHAGRRMFARACLDWSERQVHLAGALGAALSGWMIENNWVQRIPNSRTLLMTQAGRQGLLTELGVNIIH
jgi:DNA-binding transcriptional ArsR family regulator